TATSLIGYGTAGGTVTAGQPVYADTTASNKLKPCEADGRASSKAICIALHGASDGQPLHYGYGGNRTFNSAFTVGEVSVCSVKPGGIAPYADLATGDFVTILGVATTVTNLKIGILYSATAKP
ncbi:MAG: hypothetical protein ACK6EB_06295, partial [Planctomyces sp.]